MWAKSFLKSHAARRTQSAATFRAMDGCGLQPTEGAMTRFRRSNDIEVSISPEFDKEYGPGETPHHPGIYRCSGCGCEVVTEATNPLPWENHPRHLPAQGKIRWRLAVAAQREPH